MRTKLGEGLDKHRARKGVPDPICQIGKVTGSTLLRRQKGHAMKKVAERPTLKRESSPPNAATGRECRRQIANGNDDT